MNDQQNYQQEHEELTRMVEPEAPKMGAGARLINIFISPGELMQNIKLYPVIFVPFIATVLIALISIPTTLQLAELSMREMSNISIERFGVDVMNFGAGFDEYGDEAAGMDIFMLISSVASAVIVPVFMAIVSAIGVWILTKIARGSATLGQYFSMYLHIGVLTYVGSLVAGGLMVMSGNFLDVTSLAAVLMPEGNISMISFNVLSSISIFSIWSTVLVFIGVKNLNECSNVKAGVITGIAFLAFVGFTVGALALSLWSLELAAGVLT